MRVYDIEVGSRLWLGSARYPSPAVLSAAVRGAGCDVVTVSLRRENAQAGAGQAFWALIRGLGVRVLPNTAGCHSVKVTGCTPPRSTRRSSVACVVCVCC